MLLKRNQELPPIQHRFESSAPPALADIVHDIPGEQAVFEVPLRAITEDLGGLGLSDTRTFLLNTVPSEDDGVNGGLTPEELQYRLSRTMGVARVLSPGLEFQPLTRELHGRGRGYRARPESVRPCIITEETGPALLVDAGIDIQNTHQRRSFQGTLVPPHPIGNGAEDGAWYRSVPLRRSLGVVSPGVYLQTTYPPDLSDQSRAAIALDSAGSCNPASYLLVRAFAATRDRPSTPFDPPR